MTSTRADQVRMMSSQGSRQPPRQASMTAVDLDDDNIRPDAWFVYVMPVQMGVELMGSGRYGYWQQQPEVATASDSIVIKGREDDRGEEPILVLPKASVISVLVAKGKHIQGMPFPVAQTERDAS
jgi:hypothetical protein